MPCIAQLIFLKRPQKQQSRRFHPQYSSAPNEIFYLISCNYNHRANISLSKTWSIGEVINEDAKKNNKLQLSGEGSKNFAQNLLKNPRFCDFISPEPIEVGRSEQVLGFVLFHSTSESPSPKMTFPASERAPRWPQKFAETQNHPDF